MASATVTEDDLRDLDRKLKQLKLDYERYFLGSRPREPLMLRGDVEKLIGIGSNTPIQNTALRFKFQSICSRFQALKRQWNETLRKMESGTYVRHRFKADLRERTARGARGEGAGAGADLFSDYRDARLACGQDVSKLTRERLEGLLDGQRRRLAERFGPEARFRFRVVVDQGRVKLKGSRIRD